MTVISEASRGRCSSVMEPWALLELITLQVIVWSSEAETEQKQWAEEAPPENLDLHILLKLLLIFSALFSDECLHECLWLDSTFILRPPSWREAPAHTSAVFNPARFFQPVWHLLDELVFLCQNIVHLLGSSFSSVSLLNLNDLLLFCGGAAFPRVMENHQENRNHRRNVSRTKTWSRN